MKCIFQYLAENVAGNQYLTGNVNRESVLIQEFLPKLNASSF